MKLPSEKLRAVYAVSLRNAAMIAYAQGYGVRSFLEELRDETLAMIDSPEHARFMLEGSDDPDGEIKLETFVPAARAMLVEEFDRILARFEEDA